MPFQVKDLLITVVPKEAEAIHKRCLWHTRICVRPTICLCTHVPTLCHWGGTCHHCTYHYTCFNCTWQPTCQCSHFVTRFPCGDPYTGIACRAGTLPFDPQCPGTRVQEIDPRIIEKVEDITALRTELEQTLAQLSELEQTGLDGEVPDAADLEVLEAKLKDALKEIQTRRG